MADIKLNIYNKKKVEKTFPLTYPFDTLKIYMRNFNYGTNQLILPKFSIANTTIDRRQIITLNNGTIRYNLTQVPFSSKDLV